MSDPQLMLFGPPRLEREGLPVQLDTRKTLALLAYLAVEGRSHRREALAALFWPEHDSPRARGNLRRALFTLRQCLGDHILHADRSHVSLPDGSVLHVDVLAYQELVASVNGSGGSKTSIELLTQAVALYTDDFLAGFTLPDCPQFDEWQFHQTEGLRRSLSESLDTLSSWHGAKGDYGMAVEYARCWVALDRLHEPAQRRFIELLARSGQRAAAVRQSEQLVELLAEEMGVPPEKETAALVEAIRRHRFASHPKRQPAREEDTDPTLPHPNPLSLLPYLAIPGNDAVKPIPHNLPPQATRFIGREDELAELLRSLRDPDCHLITLVGPGGIGKTRLAVAAAQRVADSGEDRERYAHGIRFVPLQPVADESEVVPAIAEACGFRFYADAPPKTQLLDYLQEKRMLLLLDNFEHVMAGAELLTEIRAEAPGVQILVTSREGLRLQSEWFHPVAGMHYSPETGTSLEVVAELDAVQLFLQTARRVQPGFAIADEVDQVLRICRQVEGMPLAIELAATWLNTLSCAQIGDKIERGVDILTARHRDVPERHRSLHNVLEQSWRRLTPEEQDVLRRLSVFRGGCLLDAATTVANTALLVLASLVDKGLMRRSQIGRYEMHELIRQFAANQLAGRSDEETTRRSHSAYYLAFVIAHGERLFGSDRPATLEKVGAEIDNLRVAWTWACERRDWEALDDSLDGLYGFYSLRSRYQEADEMLDQAVRALGDSAVHHLADVRNRVLPRLLTRRAESRFFLGRVDQVDADLRKVLSQECPLHEQRLALHLLGEIARSRGQRREAFARLEESLAISREIGDLAAECEDLASLSECHVTFGELPDADRLAREAVDLSRQLGRPDKIAKGLIQQGLACQARGKYSEAEKYLLEALHISRQHCIDYSVAEVLNFLGFSKYCLGKSHLAAAKAYLLEAMTIYRDRGYRKRLANCLGDLALTLQELGETATATQHVEEGLAICEHDGDADMVGYLLWVVGAIACETGDLSKARQHLLRCLRLSRNRGLLTHVSGALLYLSFVFEAESSGTGIVSDREMKQMSALTMLQSVCRDTRPWEFQRSRASVQADRLRSSMPISAVSEAETKASQKQLEELVDEILGAEEGADQS